MDSWARCTAALLLALLATGSAVAEGQGCTPPEAPSLPDADAASAAEVASAGVVVRAFIADGRQYLACIEEREAAMGSRITAEQKQFMNLLYNGTVDRMQLVANQYNALVKAQRAD